MGNFAIRSRKTLVILTTAILCAAILYSSMITFLSSPNIAYDSGQYFRYGQNLIETGIYGDVVGQPDMKREPGYGVFLAGCFNLLHLVGIPKTNLPATLHGIVWLQAFIFFISFFIFSFYSVLPTKLAILFFLVTILSPTMIQAAGEIYPECLTLSLIALAFLFFTRAVLQEKSNYSWNYLWALNAGVIWGLAILTKSYLLYISYLLLGFSIYAIITKRRFVKACLMVAMVSLSMSSLWDFRNHHTLGSNAASPRLCNALAGKILRVETFRFPDDLAPAFSASLGTNFCISIFGHSRCNRFQIEGADGFGFAAYEDYRLRFGSPKEGQRQLLIDLLPRYFEHPFRQIFGSFLEIIRMSFFESAPSLATRGWHILGSLLVWIFFILGIRTLRCQKIIPPLFYLSWMLIGYHYLTMSQVTNLARYVFPVVPFFYLTAVVGVQSVFARGSKHALA